jgi:transcription elongation factor Elf1
MDIVDNIYICPHCGNKNLTLTLCDKSCQTVICYYCEKDSYTDKNGNLIKTHNPKCISKN